MLQKFAIFPAKQLAISKQVTPLVAPRGRRTTQASRQVLCCVAYSNSIIRRGGGGDGLLGDSMYDVHV